MNNKKNNKFLGILLIIPSYILILILFKILKIYNGDNTIIFPILMYLPIVIGLFINYKNNPSKSNMILSIISMIFIILAIYYYHDTYYGYHIGLDRLGPYVYWLLCSIICRILSIILYFKSVGWQNTVYFIIIYGLIVALSFAIGFWA